MSKIKRLFVDEHSGLHVVWKLLAGCGVYLALYYGVLYGLSAVFAALFRAWGLLIPNIGYAPGWSLFLLSVHPDFCYVLAYILAALAGMKLAGRWSEKKRTQRRTVVAGALCGAGLGLLLTVLSFGLDSMRMEWPLSEPSFRFAQLLSLAVLVAGRISGEVISKRIAFDLTVGKWGRAGGYIASCFVSVILLGGWNSPLGVLNAALLSIVGCALYEKGGLLASSALQIGWSAWTAWLFAWPNSGGSTVYRLYTVSDAWLTGGNAGAACGLGFTIGLGIIAVVLFRKELRRGIQKMNKGERRK